MLGKYTISCLGGPEGILESLACRMEVEERRRRVGCEMPELERRWERRLDVLRGRASLNIVL